ncbi:hypothetical protein H9P43_006287 [Blastocladiella emersonii ATCC 22665]|nr:hypothetical protein H9P43_006287 [Blastocladiella emersonii ATCC 22665]
MQPAFAPAAVRFASPSEAAAGLLHLDDAASLAPAAAAGSRGPLTAPYALLRSSTTPDSPAIGVRLLRVLAPEPASAVPHVVLPPVYRDRAASVGETLDTLAVQPLNRDLAVLDTAEFAVRDRDGRLAPPSEPHLARLFAGLVPLLHHRAVHGTTRWPVALGDGSCAWIEIYAPAGEWRLIAAPTTKLVPRTEFAGVVPSAEVVAARMAERGGVVGYTKLVAEVAAWLVDQAARCARAARPRHAVVTGPPGAGKSVIVQALADASGLPYRTISLTGEVTQLRESLFLSPPASPTLLVLDQLDQLSSPQADLLAYYLDHATRVIVIAVTNRVHAVPAHLLRSGRLDAAFRVVTPSAADRTKMLQHMLPMVDPAVVRRVAERAHGLVPGDLHRAAGIAAARALAITAEAGVPEHALAEELGDAMRQIPNITFRDIYALDSVIADLETNIVRPLTSPQHRSPLGATRGVFLHGPPGVGKSVVAFALINALGYQCVPLDASRVLSKVVGESERAIARVFAQARAAAPCVLLLDQLEMLASSRGSASTSSEGTGDRIVTCFLTELDGIMAGVGTKAAEIFVIAMTNQPDRIDSALLRPGRLEMHVPIPLPKTAADAAALVRGFAARHPCALTDADVTALASEFTGISGAEVQGKFRDAALAAMRAGDDEVRLEHFGIQP